MAWYFYVLDFLSGAFLCNAVPHFVAGVLGMPFQTPFAKPPGVGESSPMVNVAWGLFNILIGTFLLHHFWPYGNDVRDGWYAFWGGILVTSGQAASHFGKVRAPGYVHKAK